MFHVKSHREGTGGRSKRHVEVETEDLRRLDHEAITKEKAAFVDCQCEWGLFRAGPSLY